MYVCIQKYLECCNPNFRAEKIRFPDSELHNIFFLENLDFHLVIRNRYHKLTRHSLELSSVQGLIQFTFQNFKFHMSYNTNFSNNKFKEKCSKIM